MATDVHSTLRSRRSITAVTSDVPPRDAIERLIEAAIWAPNHHMTEPWRFHVLTGAARAAMGEAVARWLETVRDADDPKQRGEIAAARNNLNRAPVIIVVSQIGSDDPVQDLEDYAACCCATQNLCLAATGEGLATKWRTGTMAAYPAAKQHLGLDEKDRIVAFVYVGYPAAGGGPDRRSRTPADVAWLGWDSSD